MILREDYEKFIDNTGNTILCQSVIDNNQQSLCRWNIE